LSPVAGKELCARFDGGRLSSDGGVLLLAGIERRLGIAELLASCVTDARDPASTTHSYADMIRARMFAIACGHEDCDDLDALRFDPAFKLACGRLSETGDDLMSQPTLSRLENALDSQIKCNTRGFRGRPRRVFCSRDIFWGLS
jgi:hypothetical protein